MEELYYFNSFMLLKTLASREKPKDIKVVKKVKDQKVKKQIKSDPKFES